MKGKVKEWYVKTYPSDDMGQEIKEDVTFWDVFNALDAYQDVYEVIGAHDSIVRERIFGRLAELMSVAYDYIYDQWLRCE